jgi:hypothetical protein
MEKESVKEILIKWVAKYGNEFGSIPPDRESRLAAFGHLFTTFREQGYKMDDLSVYEKRIKEPCLPGPNYRGGSSKKSNWVMAVNRDYDYAMAQYMISDNVLSATIEPVEVQALPEAPEIIPVEEPFTRAAPPIDRALLPNKESGSAPYSPDKKVCDLLEVPEDHRE